MKNLVVFLVLLFLSLPCFAAQNTDTTVSYINLNNQKYYDIEILLTDGEKVLLPFKQMSEIFEVKVKTNHATKEIDFETADGKKGVVGINSIQFDGKQISSKKNFYLKKGLMEDIKDEIFCDEKDLSVIFDSVITTDKNDLLIVAMTNRELELLKVETEESNTDLPKVRAFRNVVKPDKERKIFFESIAFNNNTNSDTISQYYLNTSQKNVFFNNNSQALIKGKAYGGDLNLDLNTYNYKNELFSFGGLGFRYNKLYRGFDYELGRVRGIKEDNYTIGSQMLGFQLSNYESKPKTYRDIEGYVSSDSLVKVFVNEEENTVLSTYDGYYSLKNLYLNEPPKTLRLEELKSDGSVETVYTTPPDKRKEFTAFGGVTGYNNKLFNTNGYIYEMNTKKLLLGGKYDYKLKNNLKLDSKLSFDKIYFQPTNSIWQNIYSADSLLTSGTWKNPNNLEGITTLNTLEYTKNDNLKSKFIFGASGSRDISFNNECQGGWTLSAEADYTKDNYRLKTGIFNTSSDFYLAGGDGSYYNDRTGAFISGGISGKNSDAEGSYKKYFSNTAKLFEGGLIDFNEYSLNLHKNVEKICDARFNITGRQGSNSIAENKSYYYDLNFSKRINGNLNLQGGKAESNYQTSYTTSSDFKSLYSTIYLKGDYMLPKKLGSMSLGHDIVKYDYTNQANEYSLIKIGYTFPEFKRLTLSLGTGYKYSGSDNGFDFSANLAYRTKSGRTLNLNYQFNQMGGYIINNMYLPMSNRHSINLVMNDAFAVLPTGLKSVGFADANSGYVTASAYIDKNKNGKFDKNDVPIKNVPIKFSWVNDEIYTNRKGRVYPSSAEAGVYKAKIDLDKLPATLFMDKSAENEKMVRIDTGKNTKIEFPLKSCVGNITGKLKIIDDFGRTLNISEFIVVLNDENGEEAAYSTVDASGKFNFSGIEPGKYTVKLDDYFINKNALYEYENKSKLSVEIPYVYKEFVDIENLDLVYRTMLN